MNQKNSLGLDKCFGEFDNPYQLFEEWFNQAKKTEINDPNALALATADKTGIPSASTTMSGYETQKGAGIITSSFLLIVDIRAL